MQSGKKNRRARIAEKRDDLRQANQASMQTAITFQNHIQSHKFTTFLPSEILKYAKSYTSHGLVADNNCHKYVFSV